MFVGCEWNSLVDFRVLYWVEWNVEWNRLDDVQ